MNNIVSIREDENKEREKRMSCSTCCQFQAKEYFAQQLSCMNAASWDMFFFFCERVYFLHHDLSKMSYVGVWSSKTTLLEIWGKKEVPLSEGSLIN